MIRMKGSSLGMSFAPRGAGSSPARDYVPIVQRGYLFLLLLLLLLHRRLRIEFSLSRCEAYLFGPNGAGCRKH